MTPIRNVLVVLTDQHRASAAGYAGDLLAETPALNGLAAEGVVFGGAHTPSPVCVPARQSLITGRYPHAHGALTNGQYLGAGEMTLGHLASAAGMVTGAIGKMHFSGTERHYGFRDRWDYEDYARVEPEAAGDAASGMAYKGRYGERATGEELPTLRATNPLDRAYLAGPSPFPAERHVEAHIALESIQFLERHRDERFLLVCSFFKPHDPMMPPPEYWERYATREIPLPERDGDDEEVPAAMRRRRGVLGVEGFGDDEWRDAVRGYYGNLAYVDAQIGTVLAALEALGLKDETLVVYASDHGELIGKRREAGKQVFYDEAWRVPLIVAHPQVAAARRGATVSGLVDLVDVLPTIAEAAGLSRPVGAPAVQGISLMGMVEGNQEAVRDHVFSQLHGRPGAATGPYYGVRTEDWKLALYEPGEEQLFDLRNDPDERRNVYGEHPEEVVLLRRTLERDLA